MREKINPENSSRAFAYKNLSKALLPMVTFVKKIDVTRVKKLSKKSGHKLNCIFNYLIIKTAMEIPEFFLYIDGTTNDLYKCDKLTLRFMSQKKNGFLALCVVPYAEDFLTFEKGYLDAVKDCYENNRDMIIEDSAVIGSSALPWTTLESAVNGCWENLTNPFVVMPKIEKKAFKYYMNISFQFHHLQMDGKHACDFLEKLQTNIKRFKI